LGRGAGGFGAGFGGGGGGGVFDLGPAAYAWEMSAAMPARANVVTRRKRKFIEASFQ
jgi:hypothetical protein